MAGGINAGRSLGRAEGSIVINTDNLGQAQVTARRVGQDVNRSLAGINGGAKQAQAGMSGLSKHFSVAAGAGKLLAGVLVGLDLREVARQFTGAVGAASDLSETISKTSAVFGEAAKETLDWSRDAATAFGMSQQAALEATATIGNMFVQLGEGQDQAAGISTLMVELAADLASFHNVAGGTTAVLGAMQSAFRGEYDALQRYIPTINAATIEQQALLESGKDNAKQLTVLDKAYAAQTIMVRDAGVALGDFERTSDQTANQQRILAAQMEDTAAAVGQAFLPAWREILRTLNQIVADVRPYAENIMASFAGGLARAINRWIVPTLTLLRGVFSYWLRPGSPPRLLPDLTRWGEGAMQAYLQGWSNADLGIFDDLTSQIQTVIRSFGAVEGAAETDILAQIFGSREAIAAIVAEYDRLGSVSGRTLDQLVRAAGPAGSAVAGLVNAYLDLRSASAAAAEAQEELLRVTQEYNGRLAPVSKELEGLRAQQQALRDQQRIESLREVIDDPTSDMVERELARLEIQEIALRQQEEAIEKERDTALDAAKAKLDAARAEEKARQDAYDLQQRLIDQQMESNRLLAEEIALRERLAQEALAAEEKRIQELERQREEAARAEEKRQREEEAAAQERARQEAERIAALDRIADAELRYRLASTDTAGQISIWEEELGKVSEGSAEYYDILTQLRGLQERLADEQIAAERDRLREEEAAQREREQAQREQGRQAEERLADLERIADAELRYRLASADTAGQIAIWRQELAKATEGSAEYYDILTQLVGLEERLAEEAKRAAAGGEGASGVGGIAALIDSSAEAATTGREEFEALGEAIANVRQAMMGGEGGEGWKPPSLAEDPTGGMGIYTVEGPPPSGLPAWLEGLLDILQNAVDQIGILSDRVENFKPDLTNLKLVGAAFADLLGDLNEAEEEGLDTSEANWTLFSEVYQSGWDVLLGAAAISLNLLSGNWGTAWTQMTTVGRTETGNILTAIGKWLDDTTEAVRQWNDEIAAKWNEVLEGWIFTLGEKLADMFGKIGDWWEDVWNKFDEWGRSVGTLFTGALTTMVTALGFDLPSMLTTIQGWWTNIGTAFTQGTSGISTSFSGVLTSIGGWLTDVYNAIGNFSLWDAGVSLIKSLWGGISSWWENVVRPGWQAKIQWMVDLLPGSEPKDPSSPLRGLGERGAALVDNLMAGMDDRSLALSNTTASGLIREGASAAAPAAGLNITVNLSGSSASYAAGRELGRGLRDEMRRRGMGGTFG